MTVERAAMVTAPGTFTDGAEGPACGPDGSLYAMNWDRSATIGRVRPDGSSELFVSLPEGSIGNGARLEIGGRALLVADYSGHAILRVDLATREVTIWCQAGFTQPNDLAITSDGTLFCSDPNFEQESGRLWRVSAEGEAAVLESGMSTTNGLDVSPDERTLYVNESHSRTVWAYDLSRSWDISRKRALIVFDDEMLDGMRCDSAGNIHIARWGSGRVAVVSPLGVIVREVAVSGLKCTNVAFGGGDGRTCYVTVADTGTIESYRSSHPGREWMMMRS